MLNPNVKDQDKYQVNTLLDLWGAYVSIKEQYAHWWRVSTPDPSNENDAHGQLRRRMRAHNKEFWGSNGKETPLSVQLRQIGTVPVTGEGFPIMNMIATHKRFLDPDDQNIDDAPTEFVELFPEYKAVEPKFNVAAPIRLPDPIFQNTPQGMVNLAGDLFLEHKRGLGVNVKRKYETLPGLMTPGFGVLGDGFRTIWDSDYNPRRTNSDGSRMSLFEKYDAALDAVVRQSFPLKDYIQRLASMKDTDIYTGSVQKQVVITGTGETTSLLKAEEVYLLEKIAYLGALLQAKQDIEMIMRACEGETKQILDFHNSTQSQEEAENPLSRFISPMMRPADPIWRHGKNFSRLQQHLAVEASGTYEWVIGLAASVGDYLSELKAPEPVGAPRPESWDETPDDLDKFYSRENPRPSEQLGKEGNRDDINRLKWEALEAMRGQLEVLDETLAKRIAAPIEQPFYLEYTGSRMKYIPVAEISVWPFSIDADGEKVYIFNPLPPIVENVLLPTMTMGSWKWREFGASTN